MENKIILTDIDGVVLDWLNAFYDYLETYHQIFATTRKPDSYYGMGVTLGLNEDEVYNYVVEFNENCPEFGDIQPYAHAVEHIPHLKEEGFTFIGITSCSTTPARQIARQNNIERYFPGVFSQVYCLSLRQNKADYLAHFPKTYWLEDLVPNAKMGTEAGHKSFLLCHSYNRRAVSETADEKFFTRVRGWGHFRNLISAT